MDLEKLFSNFLIHITYAAIAALVIGGLLLSIWALTPFMIDISGKCHTEINWDAGLVCETCTKTCRPMADIADCADRNGYYNMTSGECQV